MTAPGSGLVERLRAYQAPGYGPSSPIRIDATEAADTIDALVEALQQANSDAKLAADALGNSPPEFNSVCEAFRIIERRTADALFAKVTHNV